MLGTAGATTDIGTLSITADKVMEGIGFVGKKHTYEGGRSQSRVGRAGVE